MSIEINLMEREHDLLGSNVSVRIGAKHINGFQLAKKSNCTKYERKIYAHNPSNAVREYSLKVSPTKLNNIDSDNEVLRKFIDQNLSGIRHNSEMNMIIMRIDLSKENIEEHNIATVADILSKIGNDIVVPPFVELPKEQKFDVEKYISLVKKIKDYMGDDKKIACSIPGQASAKDIRTIVSELDSESQIYIKDFDGQKVLSSTNEILVRTLMRHVRSVEKEYDEGSFVYGYDVRQNPKTGADKNFMESQILSAVGINGAGPKRKRTVLTKEILSKMEKTDPYDLNKLFCADDYRLYSINDGRVTDDFNIFSHDIFGVDYRKTNEDELRKIVAAYNYEKREKEIPQINKSISDDSLLHLIESKNTPDTLVSMAKKMAKKVNDQ